MSITVGKLFKNGTMMYSMKLIAGQKGLNNLVEWVHIVEDDDVSKFLHGNEVVFTAGIQNNNEDWLYEFAKKLNQVNTSAFVVNIGPYTKHIPQNVIKYCNEVNMPLYTIPWETRMVDMTRDICYKIMHHNNVENSIAQTIKNVIFNIGDLETQILMLERYGYLRESHFCFIAICFDNDEESEAYINSIKRNAEQIARSIKELYIAFKYKEFYVFVLVDYSEYEINKFVNKFWERSGNNKKSEIHMGISDNVQGIKNQDKNFECALMARKMAVKKNKNYIYYKDLDIYKFMLSIKDIDVLKGFYDSTIGLIEKYDNENNTNLMDFIRIYLENNGSVQIVAEKQFIHRNTVNNTLKKIEKITGCNLLELNEKVRFSIGFYVKDILD